MGARVKVLEAIPPGRRRNMIRTVVLHGWHRALMNTENRLSAMRFLAFLD